MVERSAGGQYLHIVSCRQRDWPQGTVLLVEDEAWQVTGCQIQQGARPYRYKLARAAPGVIIRGRPVYRPEAVLEEKA